MGLGGQEAFVVENAEIVAGGAAEEVVIIGRRHEDHRKMKRKLLPLITRVNFPFLPGNAEPTNSRASKLEPVATLMQHKRRIFIVTILGRAGLELFFYNLFFGLDGLLLGSWWLQGEGRF